MDLGEEEERGESVGEFELAKILESSLRGVAFRGFFGDGVEIAESTL